MAAVNWFCLVLAFAFINNYVCIKVDPNGIPNGNYTTNNLNGQQTILPYKKSTLLATATATATATTTSSISSNNNNESNNFTLLGDTELSASERTRRLIPYMAFYVPVSELPINKQYANKNNIHANKQQLMARPSATGATSGSSNSHTPIPSQYVHHSGIEYLPAPGPSAGPLSHISSSSGPSAQPFYQTSAGGLDIYHHHHHDFAGQQHQQPQQQFHLLPPIAGHAHPHLQPPGPPGPSATGLPPVSSLVGVGHGKGNGVINNHNHNAFVSFKEVNPIRQKTVQHFPPLSSTAATSSSASASAAYENIRQTSSVIKQKHRGISSGSNSGGNAAVQYRPRTKQSKINLTPFTPSNSVPGNFVPIVYTPVNSNNNNNNNILNSQALGIAGTGGGLVASDIDDSSYNQQFQQQQQQHHQQQKPQQIAIEYSSGLLPPPSPTAGSVTSLPIDIQPVPQRHRYQQQHHQRNHHNPKQQSQYYSVTTSPVNIDLTHDVVAAGGGLSVGADSLDTAHHNYHHHSSPHNIDAISPPPSTIYHPNQHHYQQQPEQVFIDAALRTSQQPQQQQQQQQLYHGSKTAIQFQPPKPESFFESEIQVQQHHHQQQQQQNIEQEKYVMYLQQRMRYNKHQHQQRQHATRQKYRERINSNSNISNDKEHEREQQYIKQHQQNPSQIFVLSSTISPPTLTHVSPGTVTALAPIRPSQQPQLHHIPQQQQSYDPNYPQHSPMHHDLYPRPIIKPLTTGAGRTSATGVGGVGVVSGSSAVGGEVEEQILTIPVHSLFEEFDTLQEQQNHYSQSPSSPSSHNNHQHSYHHHHHKSKYSKNGPAKPQYNNYVIDEPKQSLDDEQQQQQQYQQQKSQHQLELLKPTLGPPSHAFILVTTAAPFLHEPAVTQENYGSSLRPPYKNKPKIRLQPVLKENNVNYATIREQNPTRRPQIVSITPTTKSHVPQQEDETPKYVYVKEEFGQKLSATATGTGAAAGTGGAVKLKPSNKYESDDNQIPQQHYHHHHHQQQQQQQHEDNITLQPLAPRQPVTPHHHHHQQQHEQEEEQHDNVAVTGIESTPPKTILADPNELPDIRTSSLAEILHKLQESNHLPHTLTPDNIDNSIKTLIRILNNLKQTQTIVANPPQHHETPAHPPPSSPDYDYTTGSEEDQQQPQAHDISLLKPTVPNKHPGPSTGRPGIDYPNYAEIPQTSFDCSEQRYKGFFGDPETNCQVWHYCDLNGGKASFLCPNGTIFSQIALTCDWWFNVKCATTPQLYVLNERLYKYILPFTPKFPEDYSGPIVDKYLAMKFQEMEEKMRLEKEKALQEEAEAAAKKSEEADETISEDSKEDNHLEETTTQDKPNKHLKSHTPSQHHKHESVNSIVSEQSSERNLLIDDEVDDISQRGSIDNFESSTIAALTATVKPDITSFSLKPIIVSSTLGPDYDEEQLQRHDNEKRSNEKPNEELEVEIENKTKTTAAAAAATATTSTVADAVTEATVSIPTVASTNRMHITVEKVDVIEIKPDGATGHLIRDMLMNSKQTTK
ncbi:uncharacterized protein ACRADG_013117 isoform 2-T4 [Cochliomyia hominivorax]